MKKVLFTTLSIIAVAAMMLVSCKKDEPKPDNKDPETPTEEVDPELVGTWTIVGEANGWTVDAGVAMTDNDNVWTVAEVAVKGEGFKFVKDGSWDINLGAVDAAAKEDNVEFDLEKGGKNIKGAKDGVYSVTLNLLTKKAKIAFVKDLEPEFPEDTWDYTPSEAYAAEGNLWKAIDAAGATHYYYYLNPGWAETPIHGDTESDEYPYLTKTQSTYRLAYTKATTERWQCQFFMMPKEANAIALDPNKKYNFKMTLGASTPLNCFFKLLTYGPNGPKHEGAAIWEPEGYPDNVKITEAFAPVVLEHEISGIEASNLNLVFDFGTSPANVYIYIKDIIIEEAVVPQTVLTITESIIPPAYPTVNTVVSAATGEEFYVNNIANYSIKYPDTGGKIQMKGNVNSFFANRSSFGKILSVKVTCQEGKDWYPTNLKMYAGTAELPDATEIEGTSDAEAKTGTYDLSAGNYQYFTLKNTSKYAVYLQEIEITYEGAVTTPAMVLDGNFDEWTNIGAFTTDNARVTSWKAASDANNIYIYAVCPASVVKERGIWNAYIDGAFDLDNNEETGGAASYSLGNGMEAAFVAFPFSNNAGEDPTFVNGEKTDSWIQYPVGTAVGKVTSFGKVDGDNTLVELAIPRNLIGNPASGTTIAINIGMGTSPVGKQTLILK